MRDEMTYVIIGYFINECDLKKLVKCKTVRVQISQEKKERNSCSHLSDESYKNKSPNYCPECGIKVNFYPGEPATFKDKTEFDGYKEGFLAPIVPKKKCGCITCNFCDCLNCSECNGCDECESDSYYSDKHGGKKCKSEKDLNILDLELYNLDRCHCNKKKYGEGECYCVLRRYGYDVVIPGFDLTIGYKLTYDEKEGFFIPYYTMCTETESLEITDELLTFKTRIEEFLNKFDITGSFEIRTVTHKYR